MRMPVINFILSSVKKGFDFSDPFACFGVLLASLFLLFSHYLLILFIWQPKGNKFELYTKERLMILIFAAGLQMAR